MNLSQLTSPSSLEELFNRDPEKLSDQDIEKIVAELRAKRLLWANEEAEAKAQERKPRTSRGARAPKAKAKVDLKSLEIKL